jgi:hypothetical protein
MNEKRINIEEEGERGREREREGGRGRWIENLKLK